MEKNSDNQPVESKIAVVHVGRIRDVMEALMHGRTAEMRTVYQLFEKDRLLYSSRGSGYYNMFEVRRHGEDIGKSMKELGLDRYIMENGMLAVSDPVSYESEWVNVEPVFPEFIASLDVGIERALNDSE